jgi:hypothetical protein
MVIKVIGKNKSPFENNHQAFWGRPVGSILTRFRPYYPTRNYQNSCYSPGNSNIFLNLVLLPLAKG